MISSWDKTYQNTSIMLPKDRELHFGQFDHLRYYGKDVEKLMLSYGFDVSAKIVQGEEAVKFGLDRGEILYILEKK